MPGMGIELAALRLLLALKHAELCCLLLSFPSQKVLRHHQHAAARVNIR